MNVPVKLLTVATILSSLSLTACDKHPVLVLPPAELAECADEPQAPDLGTAETQLARDLMTIDYVLALRSAWGDCKADVDGLAAWLEAAGD